VIATLSGASAQIPAVSSGRAPIGCGSWSIRIVPSAPRAAVLGGGALRLAREADFARTCPVCPDIRAVIGG
jgi:hypothetical protein